MKRRWLAVLLLMAVPALAELDRGTREKARRRLDHHRPQNVVIDRLVFDGFRIVVEGHGPSPNSAADFVANVQHDPMFTDVEVVSLRERKNSRPPVYEFEFRVSVAG